MGNRLSARQHRVQANNGDATTYGKLKDELVLIISSLVPSPFLSLECVDLVLIQYR